MTATSLKALYAERLPNHMQFVKDTPGDQFFAWSADIVECNGFENILDIEWEALGEAINEFNSDDYTLAFSANRKAIIATRK